LRSTKSPHRINGDVKTLDNINLWGYNCLMLLGKLIQLFSRDRVHAYSPSQEHSLRGPSLFSDILRDERRWRKLWKEDTENGYKYSNHYKEFPYSKIPIYREFSRLWDQHGNRRKQQRRRRWEMGGIHSPKWIYLGTVCNGVWHKYTNPRYWRKPSYSVCDCGYERLNSQLSSIPFVHPGK
jgi:hypothetical protein